MMTNMSARPASTPIIAGSGAPIPSPLEAAAGTWGSQEHTPPTQNTKESTRRGKILRTLLDLLVQYWDTFLSRDLCTIRPFY
ncbi:hypothetical protein E2C01_093667 [Portunus trituberculatus]|uniref:Uncharacterized protein n=1 Tax=Portunus trituberculatus TaxID=210409 RepID=A0A5B7K128_PORTR|nr:hypothetical protein [Portunus trituberculatus]